MVYYIWKGEINKMKKAIWFDMDGTIANLYGDKNWLEKIKNEDATIYTNAKALVNLQALVRVLKRLQRNGYEIGIVTWLAKNGTNEYNKAVTNAKREWLNRHLTTLTFDHIDILCYGEPKENGRDGILFDDEERNRNNWNGIAYDVDNILGVLKAL